MIETIYKFMSKVGITKAQDKVLHAIVGVIVGVVAMATLPHDFVPYPVIAVVAVAFGKEMYDKYVKKTYFDFFDSFATIVGGFVGVVGYGVLT